jgi:hypothetical protein
VTDVLLQSLPPILLVLFLVMMGIFIFRGRKQAGRELREIPAYNRLRRMIGLAVEAGTRLHISIGRGSMSDLQAAASFAGVLLLERVARAASISDQPPVATSGDGFLSILSHNTLHSAYREIGAESQFEPTASQTSGVTPYSFAAGAMQVFTDGGISAGLLAGSFGGEVALLAEAAERNGSITIGGSENITAQAVLYAVSHEPLIGEELFAGGAYLGAAGAQSASLKAQDVVRWVLIGVLIAAALFKFLVI